MNATRTLVVWCHDWPVVAAGYPLDVPVAVIYANRVTVTSPAARADGVDIGLRRREAQGRCPGLVVLEPDPARDARAFEPVVAALEALTPRIEITFPGSCAFATRGPSRYFGGDEALAARAVALARDALGDRGTCQAGIADGPFAARLAAQSSDPEPLAVAPGESAAYLAPLPVTVLDPPELVDVLIRLGLRTLGDLAAVPAAAVVGRFGAGGSRAHRLARGLDERPPAARTPPPDLAVSAELDPPAERVDAAAFVAKSLADELHRRLAVDGLACTRVLVVAETEHGERLERLWRDEGALTPGAIADRTRWQLDGWLNGTGTWGSKPTAGITLLRLAPDEVVPARGRQLGFWGGAAEAGERAARALARVEGLLGPGAVTVAERRGGRGAGEQVTLVPVGAVDLAAPRPSAREGWVTEPWPGRLPAPAPALVPPEPLPAALLDGRGVPVGVTGRGVLSAEPVLLTVGRGDPQPIEAWAGPWPADERWWDAAAHRRRARLQVVTADGTARLVTLEAGRWSVEATYD